MVEKKRFEKNRVLNSVLMVIGKIVFNGKINEIKRKAFRWIFDISTIGDSEIYFMLASLLAELLPNFFQNRGCLV